MIKIRVENKEGQSKILSEELTVKFIEKYITTKMVAEFFLAGFPVIVQDLIFTKYGE